MILVIFLYKKLWYLSYYNQRNFQKQKQKKKIDKSVNNNKFIFIETVLRIE